MSNHEDEKNKYSAWSLIQKRAQAEKRPLTAAEQDQIVLRWKIAVFIIATTLFMWLFELFTSSNALGTITRETSYNPIIILVRGLKTKPVAIITLIILAFLIASIVAAVRRSALDDPIIVVDELGDKVIVGSSVGVRGVLTDDEEGRIFHHSSIDNPIGIPFAINFGTGELIEKIPDLRTDIKYHLANDNTLVVGPSGAGKSTGINLGAGAQHMMLGHGCLIFDPKGEMYTTLKPIDLLFKRRVWLLNFKDGELSHSDGWDCLKQIRDADIDTAIQLADTFAGIILENGDEQYWTDTIKNLFKMLLLYVTHGKTYVPPKVRTSSDDSVVDADLSSRRTWREFIKFVTTSSEELMSIMAAAMADEDDSELLGDYFTTWAEDKNYSQIRSSLANALDVFKTPAVIDILSSDEIDIDALADGNTSIYVACSGRKDTYTPVLTLFVNTVFDRTMSIAEQQGGSLDHMLFILLEEFYSLGRLDMLPRILSQSRSYKLSVMISIQTTSQLEKYNTKNDPKGRSSIESACALQICVGANEGVGYINGDTADYFSRRAGKKERVDFQVTEHRFKPLPEEVQAPFQWDQSKRTTNKAEWVYPPDRIQMITPDEILISPGPHNCRIQKKYQWSLHPLYGTYAVDRETSLPVMFLTTEHTPRRKGGKASTVQEYEIIKPKKKARSIAGMLSSDTRTEEDFLTENE